MFAAARNKITVHIAVQIVEDIPAKTSGLAKTDFGQFSIIDKPCPAHLEPL